MRSPGTFLALLLTLSTLAQASHAQRRPGAEGALHFMDWPEGSLEQSGLTERQIKRALGRIDLLPYIDTLTVGYRYEATGDEPALTLAVEWEPGQYGILDGRRIAYKHMPDSLLLTSLTIEADVFAGGKHVTEAVIRIDSLALAPSPDVVRLSPVSLGWNDLFAHTPARAARRIFDEGFELRNLDIVSASFESFGADRDERIAGTYRTDRRTVYDGHTVPGILIDLGWLFPPPVWHPGHDEDRGRRPRGNDMGRGNDSDEDRARGRARRSSDAGTGRDGDTADSGTSARPGDSGTSSSDAPDRTSRGRDSDAQKGKSRDRSDDSDDDDEEKLLPAALTAAAAVGILAYTGGTVGYFGNAKFAPYGVSAGMVRSKGGFMLQAGVNDAVLGSTDGPERLVGKILAFRQVLPVPIQPAIGAGLLLTYDGDSYTYEPSFSVGALGNFGPVLLHGAYDVALGGMEIGAAFNFRSRPR